MPLDRGALEAQLRGIGEGERWWEHREFRELPYVLQADERIQAITIGKLLGRRRPRLGPASKWLVVATDQRLLSVKHERFGRKQVDIAWGQIVRLRQKEGMRSYQVTIWTPERRYRFLIPKADALRFSGALNSFIPPPSRPPLNPDLEPLSWIPGITTVAAFPQFAKVISKVAMLSPPAADYSIRDQVERLEATVESLQIDVDRLQKQVAFLEDLLRKKSEETLVSRNVSDA